MTEQDPPRRGETSWWSKALTVAITLFLIVAAPVGLFTLYGYVKWGYGPVDTLLCVMIGNEDTTVWAPGYSNAAFAKVRPGMTTAAVRALLGDPIKIWDADGGPSCAYSYAMTSNHSHYHLRNVYLSGGVVTGTLREYYMD